MRHAPGGGRKGRNGMSRKKGAMAPAWNGSGRRHALRVMWMDRMFYLMLLPGLVYFIVFHYAPMYGVQIAFRNYRMKLGFFGSPWVGMENFERLFRDPGFITALKNTVIISLLKIAVGFTAPIVLALMLNAVRSARLRRVFQSISYLPHFLSWIVIASLARSMFSTSMGSVNQLIQRFGFEPVNFLGSSQHFRGVLVLSDCWKEVGWGSIIYLAALMGVDRQLYEAATVDGARPFRQLISITIPSIAPTIITMLILRVGGILSAGQEQVYAMYNELVYSVADILDTYALRVGLNNLKYSMSTAVSLFKSAIGLTMILITNRISKLLDENNGIF